MTVEAPSWTRSARLRLTLTYSLALYVIGALVLGAIYLGLARALDDEAITRRGVAAGELTLPDGRQVLVFQGFEQEFISLESAINERALDRLRQWSFGALGAMTVVSLGVGWVVAGRVLRPIGRITEVAREIQATDLSRRISLQGPDDELTRLADTFDAMIGRLDRAFENQRRFVHEASHELRNPLATIRTNIEVALADPDASAADLRQTAEVVDRTTERMGHVVDDLLAFARSEMPAREFTSVDVGVLAQGVAEEFAGASEAAAVGVVLDLGASGPVQVESTELRRALANLLSNAIEHAPSGTDVRLETRDTVDGVEIRVVDRGPGVAPEHRDLVFERGWRGQESRGVRPSGSGLGLAIVRQVAESHGGSVHVEPGPGGVGSTFVLRIPRRSRP